VSQGGDRVARASGRGSGMMVRGKGWNSARERSLRERTNMHMTGGKEARPRRGGMLVWEQKCASSGYPFEYVSKAENQNLCAFLWPPLLPSNTKSVPNPRGGHLWTPQWPPCLPSSGSTSNPLNSKHNTSRQYRLVDGKD